MNNFLETFQKEYYNYSIKLAAENGHIDTVKLLIDAGAYVAANDNFLIRYAVNHNDNELINLIMNHK